jgi:hypothetical protein
MERDPWGCKLDITASGQTSVVGFGGDDIEIQTL